MSSTGVPHNARIASRTPSGSPLTEVTAWNRSLLTCACSSPGKRTGAADCAAALTPWQTQTAVAQITRSVLAVASRILEIYFGRRLFQRDRLEFGPARTRANAARTRPSARPVGGSGRGNDRQRQHEFVRRAGSQRRHAKVLRSTR